MNVLPNQEIFCSNCWKLRRAATNAHRLVTYARPITVVDKTLEKINLAHMS